VGGVAGGVVSFVGGVAGGVVSFVGGVAGGVVLFEGEVLLAGGVVFAGGTVLFAGGVVLLGFVLLGYVLFGLIAFVLFDGLGKVLLIIFSKPVRFLLTIGAVLGGVIILTLSSKNPKLRLLKLDLYFFWILSDILSGIQVI